MKKDSTELYKNIETYSKRSNLTNLIYGLIFKSDANSSKSKDPINKVSTNKIQNSYSFFEGSIIRTIHIIVLDPFGYSVTDTTATVQNILFKAGNKTHIKTQHLTIKNLLLIRRNDLFDSLLVRESERLVRSQKYVHEVYFDISSPKDNFDSVDISIRVLDNWSIIPKVVISSSRLTIDLTDKNILGLGHEFQNAATWNYTNGRNAFNTNYFIPNIRNTYIRGMFHYGFDEVKNFNKNIIVERPFFSPFAKWAAGVDISQQFQKDSINFHSFGYRPFNYKFNIQDFWAGTATQIFKGYTENERTTNLILAARFFRIRYLLKPLEIYDSLHFYTHEDFYLTAIGISTRKYVQDQYIFNYGITEDVPVGKVYALTSGYQLKNKIGRWYIGLRYSNGNYYEWGYFSSNLEYGTFFQAAHPEQGVISAGVNYFTGLFAIGNWKFRQFVKPQLTIGINRFAYDSLTLKNETGLGGFNSNALTGTSRFLFSFQTQSYAPWNLIEFRFGPYLNYSFGLLGDEASGFKRSRIYSQIALGVLIKNENLVINTFQLSISFYPSIPGNGFDIFKINSFQTGDFGYRSFEIGKPTTVLFN